MMHDQTTQPSIYCRQCGYDLRNLASPPYMNTQSRGDRIPDTSRMPGSTRIREICG